VFTAGTRTNSRSEVENQVNKALGGPKKTLLQLSDALNERTEGQTVNDMVHLLRKYAGPYALNIVRNQMEHRVFYTTEVLQLPEGAHSWRSHNNFSNDFAHISVNWLLQQAITNGLKVQHILQIIYLGPSAMHYLLLLTDGRYICDCAMGLSLGLPCRHFFQALVKFKGLIFHISLVWARCVAFYMNQMCAQTRVVGYGYPGTGGSWF
ncbi:hypothetical protein GLOTRDRAFT_40967, partial [Gloeophyllum trabeum ATCC 11539]